VQLLSNSDSEIARCENVLNIHAEREGNIDDVKDSLYEELEHVFDKFPN
jgi:hypothetical protein